MNIRIDIQSRLVSSLIALLLFFSQPSDAQIQMKVAGAENAAVFLEKLDVVINITGSIATTTWTMNFRNSTNRILEGELSFPLGDGVTVSRYAIDINGHMREAVPIDKAKGTMVLEAIEKWRVDPGLLERVAGNAFRTRVYPLPAGGVRKVMIAYEQSLATTKSGDLAYQLPLVFNQGIPSLDISITVFKNVQKPAISDQPEDFLNFDQSGNYWKAHKHLNNFKSEKMLSFQIPMNNSQPGLMMQESGNHYYCLLNAPAQSGSRDRKIPSQVSLLWDASLSGMHRNHKAELEFLEQYFHKVQHSQVNLVIYSNAIRSQNNFEIRDGNWNALKRTLMDVVYDGGTQPGVLDLNQIHGSEFLLFSDGIATYGAEEIHTGRSPVYCITATPDADFPSLHRLAMESGGDLIDLNKLNKNDAIRRLLRQPLMLLGIKADPDVTEVYPDIPIPAASGNMLTAISYKSHGKIILQYGYGKEVTMEKEVFMDPELQMAENTDLGRIWAEQKIAALDTRYELNKATIESLGRRFGLVTRNTSLIVLENLSDYIRYRIQPPREMQLEYDRAMKTQQDLITTRIQNRNAIAERNAKELWDWWKYSDNRKVAAAPQPTVQNNIPSTSTALADTVQRVVVRRVRSPQLLAPDNPGARTMKSAEQIEHSATREVSDMASLSTQVSQSSTGSGLNIGGGRASGTRYMVDGVALAPGTAAYTVSTGANDQENEEEDGTEKRKYKFDNNDIRGKGSFSKANFSYDYDLLENLRSLPIDQQYDRYLKLRQKHLQLPAFYFQVAAHFLASQQKELGIRILSNLAELDLENYELYKMLGYQLRQCGESEAELKAFRKVLDWRPMDPQSLRDYGLALADNGHYQEAVDTLMKALTNDVDESLQSSNQGIEETLLCDINSILSAHSREVDNNQIPRNLIQSLPSDIRVVINWNMKNTDIDLWVTDPMNEKCYYGNKNTSIGGHISADITQGFGPEQFLLHHAIKGAYKIEVNYYGDQQVKIAGPTTVMAEVYKNWGSPNQHRQIIVLQMKPTDNGGVFMGTFRF